MDECCCSLLPEDDAAGLLDLDEDEGVADDDDDAGDGPGDEEPVGARRACAALVQKVTLVCHVAPAVLSIHLQAGGGEAL